MQGWSGRSWVLVAAGLTGACSSSDNTSAAFATPVDACKARYNVVCDKRVGNGSA